MSFKDILKRLESLEIEVVVLRRKSASDDATIARLNKRVETLEKKLEKANQKLQKDSSNSSIPPSQDPFRKKKDTSLRTKSGKKPGGQPGHKGTHLQMSDHPDHIEEYRIDTCEYCNMQMEGKEDLLSRRQVIDIPPIKPIITEHRVYQSTCTCCGKLNKGEFPSDVKGHVSYGTGIDHLIVYLNVRQYISYSRIKEFLYQYCSIDLSEGTIENKIKKVTENCLEVYEQLRLQITKQTWAGSDETSIVVDGKKHWLWVWQNNWVTYLKASDSRGFVTVENTFPQGLLNTILVSDRLAAQLKQETAGNQICIPHLLRDIKGHLDAGRTTWFEEFKQLLLNAMILKKEAVFDSDEYTEKLLELELRKSELLNKELQYDSFSFAMQKQMKKVEQYLFTFLYHQEVPPDNNSSERAIRNAKVKQKVSGMFKGATGLQCFAVLRSIIDTGIKRGMDALTVLQNPQLLTT